MTTPAPTYAVQSQDAATVQQSRLVAVVVCDGREIPIYARRDLDAVARDAVVAGLRHLSLATS